MAGGQAGRGDVLTTRRIFERGGLDRLGDHLGDLGAQRALLVVSPRRRWVDRATAAAGAVDLRVFDAARVHVPVETVSAARDAVDAHASDTVVALGGGAAIGLGKALSLERPLVLVAVPTTYSGSEMTNIFGTTDAGLKRTGRDERVRAALVLYDAELTAGLPVVLTIQSLANSIAQIVSALSTDSLPDPDNAVSAVAELWRCMLGLRDTPRDLALREAALRASSRAGEAVDVGVMGHQHKLAHRIGGRFDLVHSATHSILLTPFIAHIRTRRPGLATALDRAAGVDHLEHALRDLLRACGAPTSLRELGVGEDELERLLDEAPELPADLARAAYRGE